MRIPTLIVATLLIVAGIKGKDLSFVLVDAATITSTAGGGGSASSSSSSSQSPTNPSHRRNNLDYLNAPALEYFLSSPTLDYDAVILFYANWDRHSHSFAALYAQIADLLEAGTKESQLILGLFDCEADANHARLCTRAGITHYPTTIYFSFSGRNKRYKFGGNWAYGDAVLDWIKTLRALSNWHRAGWGKRLRSWVFGGMIFGKKDGAAAKKPELPIGVPSAGPGSSSSSSFLTGPSSSTADASALRELNELREEKEASNDLLVRSAAMMEATLFPMKFAGGRPPAAQTKDAHNKTFTDLFAYLNQTDGWSSKEAQPNVLRSCLQDISLEYCQRYTAIMTEEFLAEHPNVMADKNNEALIQQLSDRLQEQEPFCMMVDACIVNGFAHAKCRPSSCPFGDPTACRFLTSCFYESMQQQYAAALGVSLPNATLAGAASPPGTESSGAERMDEPSGQATSQGKKKSGWGFGG